MIRTNESLKLAQIKFKTRKVRNILSGCSVSLGIIIIFVFLFATTGITNLAKDIFREATGDRFFVVDNQIPAFDAVAVTAPVQEGQTAPKIQTIEAYKKTIDTTNIKNIYIRKFTLANKYIIPGITPEEDKKRPDRLFSLNTSDALFVQDFLFKNHSFDDVYNGKIPIIIPKDYIVSLEQPDNKLTNKETYELAKKATNKYLDKTFKLSEITDEINYKYAELNNLEFIVVGYSDQFIFDSIVFQYSDPAITIPNWALDKSPELKKAFATDSNTTFIAEFNNKAGRDAFVLVNSQKNIQPMYSRYEIFTEFLVVIKKIGYGIGGFFLAISALFILTTVGKIVSDSRKEIGVFRAIGAQRADIRKIFFSYSFLITTVGYLLGLIIAIILVIIASLAWGESIFYMLINLGITVDVDVPVFLFLSWPVLEIIGLYVVSVTIGFIASLIPAIRAARIDPIKALREE